MSAPETRHQTVIAPVFRNKRINRAAAKKWTTIPAARSVVFVLFMTIIGEPRLPPVSLGTGEQSHSLLEQALKPWERDHRSSNHQYILRRLEQLRDVGTT